MNLGNNLIAENQLEKGIIYSKKALTYSGYPDEQRHRVLMHLDIADTYVKLHQPQEAARYLDTAVQLNATLKNWAVSALVANTQGSYYEYMHDQPRALLAYQQAVLFCDSAGNDYLKAGVAGNMAAIYFTQGDYPAATRYALLADTLARTSKQYKVVSAANEVLKKVAEKKGDYKSALTYAMLYKQYADSATNSATQRVTLSLESKYQNEKKEAEIAALKTVAAEKELSIVKRNRMLIISGLSGAILLLVLGLLYRNSKQKQTIAEKEQRLQQEQIKFLERQQQLVSLQSMLNGQETERTRIAKDLHDGLGGLFSTVKMNFSVLQHENVALKSDPLFQKSYEMVDTASAELRRIAHNMMPEVLMKLGLIQAVQDMCVSVSSSRLLKVSLQAYGMSQRFNAGTEIMLYRIIQELINNIIKHAQATQAIIQFNKDGNRLTVTVEDNGRGFNTQEVDAGTHTGMETVKSRVNYLNGNINIDSQNGIGTTVLMEFLVNEEVVSL
jgi:signal transduction histidine kinase